MAEEKKVETQTTEVTKNEEKMIPQSEVNTLAGNSREEGRKSVLKDLGIENIEDTKKALNEFKKYQDSQKSELEKLTEENENLKNDNHTLSAEKRTHNLQDETKIILKEMGIEDSYSKTVVKLMDSADIFVDEKIDVEILKTTIENTIERDLPMFVKNTNKKVGVEKQQPTMKSSSMDYLEQKYKNNPYFKK